MQKGVCSASLRSRYPLPSDVYVFTRKYQKQRSRNFIKPHCFVSQFDTSKQYVPAASLLVPNSRQEIATLREELARLRRQAEDDRRLAVNAEADKEKAMSLAREERHSLQKDLDLAKVLVDIWRSFSCCFPGISKPTPPDPSFVDGNVVLLC